MTRFGKGFYCGRQSAETMSSLIDTLISKADENRGITLHEARNRIVALDVVSSVNASKQIALKIFAEPRRWKKIESMFRTGKAHRAFFVAVHLVQHDIATPIPVAYVEKRDRGLLRQSVLVTERISGVELRDILHKRDKRFGDGPTIEFVNQLGKFLKKVHETGVVHRDISDGNVLVDFIRCDPRFMLLDLNRGRIKKHVGTLRGVRDIVRVGIQPEMQKAFLSAYMGRANPPLPAWFLYRMMKRSFEIKLAVKRFMRTIAKKAETGSSS